MYEVRLARLQPRPEIRQEVTARLVKACFDPNSGMHHHTFKWLLAFGEADISATTKEFILQSLTKLHGETERHMRAVLICGVANIREALPRLEELLIDELEYKSSHQEDYHIKWFHTVGWQARLARARMGVQEDINRCIELAEAEENFDHRVTVLLHDLGYIHQPETIDYLRRYLNSDRRLPPTNPDALGEPCSHYVMNIIAESLNNYPIERREGRHYTQEEIELCREWMAKQTKWEIIRQEKLPPCYNLKVGPITHQARKFGVVADANYKQFRPGERYEVKIKHTGSNLDDPDYDDTAEIEAVTLPDGVVMVIDDPDGILQVYDTPPNEFYPAGKTAKSPAFNLQ